MLSSSGAIERLPGVKFRWIRMDDVYENPGEGYLSEQPGLLDTTLKMCICL